MGSCSTACRTRGLFLPRRYLLGYPHYIFYYCCLWVQDKRPVSGSLSDFNLLAAYCDLGKLADHIRFHANSSYCLCMQQEQGDCKLRMSFPSRCSLLSITAVSQAVTQMCHFRRCKGSQWFEICVLVLCILVLLLKDMQYLECFSLNCIWS